MADLPASRIPGNPGFRIFLAGLCSLAPCTGAKLTAGEVEKPNIIVILADDLGYADLGIQGCKDIPTPNIDSIAQNGILFTNSYVSSPICSPTRAALMSGQYQQRHGDEELTGKPANKDGLSTAVTALPQRLKTAGYSTGLIGKWHLGTDKEHHPLARGFDEFYGFLMGARSYYPMSEEAIAESDAKPIKGDPRMYRGWEAVADPEYTTDAFGQEAAQFIERHKKQPFFLLWASQAPHAPVQPCPRLIGKFSGIQDKTRREYASMVAAMDEAVGRILNAVKEAHLESRTLIFFLSDNGGFTPNSASNLPLRGEKSQTWEGGIHVPFFVQWKGKLPAGVKYDDPVIQLDITATALALAGLELKPEWQLDGVNLMPYLTGEKNGPPHDTLYFRLGKNWAVRQGAMKAVDSTEGHASPKTSGEMLFALDKDIEEKSDLKNEEPEKMKELKNLFQGWSREVDREAGENQKRETNSGAPVPDPGKAEKPRENTSPSAERTAARKAARKAAKTNAPVSPAN